MGKLAEELKAYLNSEEGKAFLEKQKEEYRFKETLKKKYNDKIKSLTSDERIVLIRKIITKYDSKEYKDKELKCGRYEPSNDLFWTIFEYAQEYGRPLITDGEFCVSSFEIDDKFIVEMICGQGSFVHITEVSDDYVFVHDIEENFCEIFSPDNKLIVKTNNVYCVNDIMIQIRKKKLEGYYVMFNGYKLEITNYGRIKNPPKGFFEIYAKQLRKLLGF